jgi:hypothetical protein
LFQATRRMGRKKIKTARLKGLAHRVTVFCNIYAYTTEQKHKLANEQQKVRKDLEEVG